MANRTTHFHLAKPTEAEYGEVSVLNGNMDIIDEELHRRGTTVNGAQPDAEGNCRIDEVQFAGALTSAGSIGNSARIDFRTTGGGSVLPDTNGRLLRVLGTREHVGFVPEVLTVEVQAAARESGADTITAVIDRDTFVAYVADSGTTTLTFATSWNADPALYGITVGGTPILGDKIVITYSKEDRGTIVPAAPTRFVSTGWNLYDHEHGYARVKKYSGTYGFLVGGTYTALQYSETLTGTKTAITPSSGLFSIAGDGYIWVTGGDSTTTYILMTQGDWTTGYTGDWEAYTEHAVSLAAAMSNFPAGLLFVAGIADEIDLVKGIAVSRIERMAYSAANLTAVKASGRPYEADTSYIYAVRETPVVYTAAIDGTFTVCSRGNEFVDGSGAAPLCQILYGTDLAARVLDAIVPANEGTAGQVLTSDGAGGSTWADGVSTADIANAVDDWLDEHVPSGGTVLVDDTLTEVGQAADAKAAGDAIALKADADDAVLTGSVSLGRKSGSTVGDNSAAIGDNVEASGKASAAFGKDTVANHRSQIVGGEFNAADPSSAAATEKGTYAEIIGNGTSGSARSNARVLEWTGDERLQGDLYIGCNADSTGGKRVAKEEVVDAKAPAIDGSASGAVATFADGADGLPIGLTAKIEPVQDLHGYSNPWVGGAGKNLAKFTVGKGIHTDGTVNDNASRAATVDPIIIDPTKTYVVSSINDSFFIYSVWNGTTLVRRVAQVSSGTSLDTSDGDKLYVCVYKGGSSSDPIDPEAVEAMMRVSTESATYEPYSNICPITGFTGANISRSGADTSNPTVYNVSFPSAVGTVYGGTLTVNKDGSGTLVVDQANYTIPSTVDLSYSSNTKTYYFNSTTLPAAGTGVNYASAFDGICDSLKPATASMNWASKTEGYIGWVDSTKLRFRLPNIAENDTSAAVACVTGMQVVYRLATPVTYSLTAAQITSLFGLNNVWCDTGDITSLAYEADTKKYIDNASPYIVTYNADNGATPMPVFYEWYIMRNGKFRHIMNNHGVIPQVITDTFFDPEDEPYQAVYSSVAASLPVLCMLSTGAYQPGIMRRISGGWGLKRTSNGTEETLGANYSGDVTRIYINAGYRVK